jgi:hypothetical protein
MLSGLNSWARIPRFSKNKVPYMTLDLYKNAENATNSNTTTNDTVPVLCYDLTHDSDSPRKFINFLVACGVLDMYGITECTDDNTLLELIKKKLPRHDLFLIHAFCMAGNFVIDISAPHRARLLLHHTVLKIHFMNQEYVANEIITHPAVSGYERAFVHSYSIVTLLAHQIAAIDESDPQKAVESIRMLKDKMKIHLEQINRSI